MLYREIIALCSQIHTEHINKLCGQKVEFFNFRHGGMYSELDFKGLLTYLLLGAESFLRS